MRVILYTFVSKTERIEVVASDKYDAIAKFEAAYPLRADVYVELRDADGDVIAWTDNVAGSVFWEHSEDFRYED